MADTKKNSTNVQTDFPESLVDIEEHLLHLGGHDDVGVSGDASWVGGVYFYCYW